MNEDEKLWARETLEYSDLWFDLGILVDAIYQQQRNEWSKKEADQNTTTHPAGTRIRTAKASKQRVADLKAKGRPHLSPADIAKADRETRHTLDMAEIERQFWAHWESKGRKDLKSVGGAFMNFTKLKCKQSLGRA